MVSRDDYDALPLSKPQPKRDRSKARQQHNSTLVSYEPMKKINEARLAEQHERDFGPQSEACRAIGICCCCGKTGTTVPHHVRSRGAGGDDSWTVPMLWEHHQQIHALGSTTFWQAKGVDPETVVEGMREWVAAGCPEGYEPFGRR